MYSTYSSIKIDNLSLYLKPFNVSASYSGSSSPFTFFTPSSNFLELINCGFDLSKLDYEFKSDIDTF